jgi:[CysO sulfur-carrier protein]-S-L-cysteine hydrolase
LNFPPAIVIRPIVVLNQRHEESSGGKRMNKQMQLLLAEKAFEEIARHAQDAFPEECCGVVLSSAGSDRVHRLNNIQNQLHALDPQTYPRTAEIAYAMDYKELELVIEESRRNGAKLKAFYHSHPNHDAYFSTEDKAFASPFGEPAFPGSAQIVVAIYNRVVTEMCAFVWSDAEKDFVKVPLAKT